MQEGSPDPTTSSEPHQAGNEIGAAIAALKESRRDRKLEARNKKPFLPPLRSKRPPLTADETKAMLMERAKRGVEKLRRAEAKRAARAAKRAEAVRLRTIEAGDLVHYGPANESLHVIGVDTARGMLCFAGYPPTIAEIGDCKLERKGNGVAPHEIVGRRKAFGGGWDDDGLYGPDGTLIDDGIEHLGTPKGEADAD